MIEQGQAPVSSSRDQPVKNLGIDRSSIKSYYEECLTETIDSKGLSSSEVSDF